MPNEQEPVITLPKGVDPHLDDDGEPVVTLTDFPNKPTYPLNDPVVAAVVTEHLNPQGYAKDKYIQTALKLLLARAARNGFRSKGGQDLYEENSITITVVLFCEKNKTDAEARKKNTVALAKELKQFAAGEGIDTSDWPTSPKGFSLAIKNMLPRLKLYGWTAIKLNDGNRSWEFKPVTAVAGKRAKNSHRTESSDASDASDANHTPETNHGEDNPKTDDSGEVGDTPDGEQEPGAEE